MPSLPVCSWPRRGRDPSRSFSTCPLSDRYRLSRFSRDHNKPAVRNRGYTGQTPASLTCPLLGQAAPFHWSLGIAALVIREGRHPFLTCPLLDLREAMWLASPRPVRCDASLTCPLLALPIPPATRTEPRLETAATRVNARIFLICPLLARLHPPSPVDPHLCPGRHAHCTGRFDGSPCILLATRYSLLTPFILLCSKSALSAPRVIQVSFW